MDAESPTKRFKAINLIEKFKLDRKNFAESIMEFTFNKKRLRLLTEFNETSEKCRGVLYWMCRDARVQDNWAFLFAQRAALKCSLSLHVCFCVTPVFLEATMRHYKFLIRGLMEIEKECQQLNINFHLLHGEPGTAVPEFVKKYKMGSVVTDFFPLNLPMSWLEDVQSKLPKSVSMCQVDAHNVVPCWHASEKLEYAARTIRNKISTKLEKFLTEFPPVVKHPYTTKQKLPRNDWESILKTVKADNSVDEITWAKPGYESGIKELEDFINDRLKIYNDQRNNPLSNAVSNLSPWFHFGMISVQRCILEIKRYRDTYTKSVDAFIEEAIIRRELSDNFCYYNKKYDDLSGAWDWAIKTLNDHRKDKRQYIYNLHELEHSQTHDDLWNACQNQMVKEGKMHGFLRMYWAKKILEWTKTPEEALNWAIHLNNKYSIDGCDPNGYVGCMWSICGVHDQGWKERNIFGKIRYMNYEGCKKKFDVPEYVAMWGKKPENNNAEKIK